MFFFLFSILVYLFFFQVWKAMCFYPLTPRVCAIVNKTCRCGEYGSATAGLGDDIFLFWTSGQLVPKSGYLSVVFSIYTALVMLTALGVYLWRGQPKNLIDYRKHLISSDMPT